MKSPRVHPYGGEIKMLRLNVALEFFSFRILYDMRFFATSIIWYQILHRCQHNFTTKSEKKQTAFGLFLPINVLVRACDYRCGRLNHRSLPI